jgi:hypothetical protein
MKANSWQENTEAPAMALAPARRCLRRVDIFRPKAEKSIQQAG